MNMKKFVTKIIHTSQNQIMYRTRSLPNVLSLALICALGLLSLTSIPTRGMTAYAQLLQQQQGQIPPADLWYQSLDMARSKVQAALTPGAFGHGVPELHDLTTNDILMAFGISILGGIMAYMAVKALLQHMNEEKIDKISPLNKTI